MGQNKMYGSLLVAQGTTIPPAILSVQTDLFPVPSNPFWPTPS